MISPQRARTYLWLFAVMSATVCANLLLLQPKSDDRTAAAGTKAMRAGGTSAGGTPQSGDQVADTVRPIQRILKEMRIYPGQLDGKPTPVLHAAIIAYEQAQALPITGEPTQALLRELIVGPSASPVPVTSSGTGVAPGSAADRLVRDMRQMLNSLGYAAGAADGRINLELIQGIRAFERDNGLPQTGRISANLLLQIQRSAAAFRTGKAG